MYIIFPFLYNMNKNNSCCIIKELPEFSSYMEKKLNFLIKYLNIIVSPQIILEIRKEGDNRIPTWIIIGSTLGGLLLLALLSLALWKVSHRIIHTFYLLEKNMDILTVITYSVNLKCAPVLLFSSRVGQSILALMKLFEVFVI